MMRSLVLGTILGGLTAFLWSSVSWEVLGWHEKPLLSFQNDQEVSAVIMSHSVKSGVYLLPGGPPMEGMTSEQKKAAQAITMEKMQKGPIMFAAVRREGFGSYARGLIIQLVSLMAAAVLLTWLLASVIADIPNWNWWGFSGMYTVVNLVDFTLMWLIAGLVIAKVAKPRTT